MTDTPPESEYVYVIGHEMNYAKVGRSKAPHDRLRDLQTSCPYKLWLVTQFPVDDSRGVESALHDLLEDRHVRGEWFEMAPADYDEIVDMARMAASTQDFGDVEQFREWQERKRRMLF